MAHNTKNNFGKQLTDIITGIDQLTSQAKKTEITAKEAEAQAKATQAKAQALKKLLTGIQSLVTASYKEQAKKSKNIREFDEQPSTPKPRR